MSQEQEIGIEDGTVVSVATPETTEVAPETIGIEETPTEAAEDPQPRKRKRVFTEESRKRMAAAQQARRLAEKKPKRKTEKPLHPRPRGRPKLEKRAIKLGRPAKASVNSQYLILYPKGRGFAYRLFESKDEAEVFANQNGKTVAAFKSISVQAAGVRFSE